MCRNTEKMVEDLDVKTIAQRISDPQCAEALADLLHCYYYAMS